MIKQIENQTEINIDKYIGEDYYKCLYLYLDYKKYGLNNPNVQIWCQEIDGQITALLLKYYSGMHIYSRNNDFNIVEVVDLIIHEKPSIICGSQESLMIIEADLSAYDYEHEYGYVRELSYIENVNRDGVIKAKDSDFDKVADLLFKDDDIGSSYTKENLVNQIVERNKEQYGRNYIIKDENIVVAHAGTGAENEKVAMLNYVITHPDYRKKGLATKVCGVVCEDLIHEGKKVYLINYTNESTKLYDKLGFKVCCNWEKLYLDLRKEGK